MEITKIPFGYIKNNEIFLGGETEKEDRKIGEVKEDNTDASVQYFVDKFEKFKEKIDDLENKVNESENKGSFLMKLLHLKETINEHCGLGDYKSLKDKLSALEVILTEVIEKNREKNTEIKKALIVELDEALTNQNWKETQEMVIEIRGRWIKTGGVKEDLKEAIESEFHNKVEDFFERKRAFDADRRLLTEKREREYQSILREARNLVRNNDPNAKNRIKELQAKWREVGPIPRPKYGPLQSSFKRACSDAFRSKPQRQRIVRQIPNYQLNENLEKKSRLVERAKLLKQDPSLDKANELKEKWKAVGPVPKEKNHEISNEFFDAISFVHEVVYLDKLAEENNEDWNSIGILEQIKIKIDLLDKLIARDQRELDNMQSNADNVTSRPGAFDRTLNDQLQTQKRKVRVKKEILSILKEIG